MRWHRRPSLWRQIRGALGEEECKRVARQGWQLQHQAVSLPPSQAEIDQVAQEVQDLTVAPQPASAAARAASEADRATVYNRGHSSSSFLHSGSSYAFRPSELDLDIADVGSSSFLLKTQPSFENNANYSGMYAPEWSGNAGNGGSESSSRDESSGSELHSATLQAAAASRLKRGLSSMQYEVGDKNNVPQSVSASSSSTASWVGNSQTSYGYPQSKRRYLS
ncbi:Hypothetical Protein FCC1311_096422 [Hondaea fermentalgiana]|uniref:Uncharacterized protein n=1 Tax=Hondaea fermentalgiana TaxID=2315210 RepID=A0A2R5GSY0_9STRA|nr:Hypothetical Protein FCC1311_096422 [Hondaea fermentalgiana]|eukprot:GBG33419.1 Hypothetical Protein FCC1311_096422 [Hondaea fermentalgiana]